MESFAGFDLPFEIVVVDNMSKDRTVEILQGYASKYTMKILRRKSTRGMGRRLCLEIAGFDYVVMLDADVRYHNLNYWMKRVMGDYKGKIVLISGRQQGTNMTCGPKAIFEYIGGYPDLNFCEDAYVWRIAKKAGLFQDLGKVDGFADEFEREAAHLDKRTERRYEKNFLRLFWRRSIITRDILVVERKTLRQMLGYYNTQGRIAKVLQTTLLYCAARILLPFTKIPSPEEKLEMIEKNQAACTHPNNSPKTIESR
ncbi:MAG: glycosyltransferase family 2 protein [Candidatus Thermoplasmatota archaeon]|jgi:glycosyltransferase involved in cell wall biosynthesis|nr:glycosyltransferase family 2 protein [Candidatus Thermoplasmatota archaeon]